MYGDHWSDDDLVARLYGVKPEDAHLWKCDSCIRRWESVRSRYVNLRPAAVEVPESFLSAQRRAIEARLGKKHTSVRLALVPVMAALILAVGFVAIRPVPQQKPVPQAASDTKLFEDIFAQASSTEPGPVSPIRSLFEEPK